MKRGKAPVHKDPMVISILHLLGLPRIIEKILAKGKNATEMSLETKRDDQTVMSWVHMTCMLDWPKISFDQQKRALQILIFIRYGT